MPIDEQFYRFVPFHWAFLGKDVCSYRVLKRWCHKKLFLHFSVLDTMSRWSMMKNILSLNLVGIGSWGPEIWWHEYLLSLINWNQCKLAWFQTVMNQAKFTLISMGLIRYSCGHILDHHEQIHVKFGVGRFFIMLYRNMQTCQPLGIKNCILWSQKLYFPPQNCIL